MSKVAGIASEKIFGAADKKLIDAASREGNLARVQELLDKKRVDLKKDIDLNRRVNAANVRDIRDRLANHKAATAARDAEHKSTIARLDADIAEAKTNLDTKRVDELQTIKAAHEKRLADAEALEAQRIRELQNEHDRVVAKA
jgi:hypothetical protein